MLHCGGLVVMSARSFSGVCLVLSLLIAVSATGLSWSQQSFRLTPGAEFALGMEWGHLWLGGEFLVPAGGRPGSGTRVQVGPELGISSADASAIFLKGTILNRHVLSIDYLMAFPSGLQKVEKRFRFQNKTYMPGVRVETKLDFNWLRCMYGYKVLQYPAFWIAPGLGIHHVRHGLTLKGRTVEGGLISNTRRLDGTYPAVGLEFRYLFPYGLDLCMELEGFHLIVRGYVASSNLGLMWEVRPDVILTLRGFNRLVHFLEDNQPLNNQWQYSLSGFSGGIAFTF